MNEFLEANVLSRYIRYSVCIALKISCYINAKPEDAEKPKKRTIKLKDFNY